VTQARHWNEEKKRAYRVADNQLESWREEFRNLKFGEFDLGLSRYFRARMVPRTRKFGLLRKAAKSGQVGGDRGFDRERLGDHRRRIRPCLLAVVHRAVKVGAASLLSGS
jgi:hypothetical protein